jgi:hypothetical protein
MSDSYKIIDHTYDVVVVGAGALACAQPWAPPKLA